MATHYNTITPDLRTAYRNNLAMSPLGSIRNIGAAVSYQSSALGSFTVSHVLCSSDSFTVGSTSSSELTFSVLNTASGVSSIRTGSVVRASLGYEHDVWGPVSITEQQFNADKARYWTASQASDCYIRCGSADAFDSSAQYYSISGQKDKSWFFQGVYYVDDSETSKGVMFTTFKAYDIMYSKDMNNKKVSSSFIGSGPNSFNASEDPKENADRLNRLYSSLNFNTDGMPTSGASSIVISGDMSLRDVVSRLAIAGGCNVVCGCNNNGNESIRYISSDSTESFCYDNTYIDGSSHQTSPYTFPVNRVYEFSLDGYEPTDISFVQADIDVVDASTGSSSVVTYQYPPSDSVSTGVGISFDDTFFGSPSALQDVYENIVENGHYIYQGFSARVYGSPWLQCNNMVSITFYTRSNQMATYSLAPFKIEHTYNGSISTAISSSNVSDTTNSTESPDSAAISVSKLDAKIANVRKMVVGTYGVCSTGSTTVTKKVYIPNFVLFDNQKVSVRFDNANTASNPRLRVYWDAGMSSEPATEAMPIYVNTVESGGSSLRPLRPSDVYSWAPGQIATFTYISNAVGNGPAWVIESSLSANFIGIVEDDGGKYLRLSTQPDGAISEAGYHTDVGSNYFQIVRDYESSGSIEHAVDFKASSDGVTVGSDADHQVSIRNSGIDIRNGDTQMSLGAILVLQSSNSSTEYYDPLSLPDNTAVLASGYFNSNQINCNGLTMYNSEQASQTTNFILEKRQNGHCSLKMV